MITKKDARDYLDQIFMTEMKMKAAYTDLSKKVQDSTLVNLFDSLQKEEQEHADLVTKLQKIIEENWPE